ncbi:MAG: hypothetical protein HQL69_04885 [Magnetococcales bacterium]|nr:hypothetical protein [Magnetococcales bacterium]
MICDMFHINVVIVKYICLFSSDKKAEYNKMLKLNNKSKAIKKDKSEQNSEPSTTTIPSVFQLGNGAISYTGVIKDIGLSLQYPQQQSQRTVASGDAAKLADGYNTYEIESSTNPSDIYGMALCVNNSKTNLSQFLPKKKLSLNY